LSHTHASIENRRGVSIVGLYGTNTNDCAVAVKPRAPR
jgi:hypothetical protein